MFMQASHIKSFTNSMTLMHRPEIGDELLPIHEQKYVI